VIGVLDAPEFFNTCRLVLRPILAADSGPIFEAYGQDVEVTRFLIWRPHRGQDETDVYIARCLATPPTAARTYVLTSRADGAVLGAFDLRWPAIWRIDFGYVLAQKYWGRGLMTEVLTEVVSWALRQDNVFRVGAVCDVENIGSARVMEKAGLTREGLLRRWLVHPNISDEPRDCFSYARVK
jgi:RimJ/RimL family protein N-acetyltransferase